MSNPNYKDPDVNKLFGFDWDDYLAGSLTIAASVWTAPAGITVVDDSFTTTTTTVELSGGTDGEDYEIHNTITDSNGQTEEKTLVIQVREASWRLTETELLTLAEIIQETLAVTEPIADDLTVNQVAYLRLEFATWAPIRNSHVRVLKDVDFDNERKRAAIRQRVRKALGLSLISDEALALNGGVLSIFELEVGSNFG